MEPGLLLIAAIVAFVLAWHFRDFQFTPKEVLPEYLSDVKVDPRFHRLLTQLVTDLKAPKADRGKVEAILQTYADDLGNALTPPPEDGIILFGYQRPDLSTIQHRTHQALNFYQPSETYKQLFAELQDHTFPVYIPERTRDEHTWICAAPGHGKTSLIQEMIAADLPAVLEGKRSIIVMDSQNQLIPELLKLKVFDDHPEKLVYINPEKPPKLNLFTLKPTDTKGINAAIQTYRFIVNTLLLSSEFTDKQGLVFEALMRLLMRTPKPSILVFLELLTQKGFQKYSKHVKELHDTAQDFFRNNYNHPSEYKDTREHVARRIHTMLFNDTFREMLAQDELDLDLGAAMEKGSVIIIDTNKGFLQPDNSAMFGGLFLGLIYQELIKRKDTSTPCTLIIDECHEYFKHNVGTLEQFLVEARKYRVGMVLAHQNITPQLTRITGLQGSFSGTAIKMMGGVEHAPDARTLASLVRVEPEAILALPKLRFIVRAKGMGTTTRDVRYSSLKALPQREYKPETVAIKPVQPKPKEEPPKESKVW